MEKRKIEDLKNRQGEKWSNQSCLFFISKPERISKGWKSADSAVN
jgi:hypothetical protein